MLTAEIKINGKLLGHLYIINKGPLDTTWGGPGLSLEEHHYEYEYFEVSSGKKPKTGQVMHRREDGALTLIRICAEDMGL